MDDPRSISHRADPRGRRASQGGDDKREVAFFVRAKTGPGKNDWSPVGVALPRRNGKPGFSIKLNTLPITKDWDGGLVLVPPFEDEQNGDE